MLMLLIYFDDLHISDASRQENTGIYPIFAAYLTLQTCNLPIFFLLFGVNINLLKYFVMLLVLFVQSVMFTK